MTFINGGDVVKEIRNELAADSVTKAVTWIEGDLDITKEDLKYPAGAVAMARRRLAPLGWPAEWTERFDVAIAFAAKFESQTDGERELERWTREVLRVLAAKQDLAGGIALAIEEVEVEHQSVYGRNIYFAQMLVKYYEVSTE
jgi:hypothetical protein